ncbi:MAG: calcium/sodium antiporter [Sphingomonadaceae bacterium]|nr:calcium/sodium antiporter [Sphingomonadaceae bacterium]
MGLSLAALIGGLVLLIGGGELLVRGAVRIAERAGVSAALVGTVIVGFGTSLPELAASLDAVLAGSPGIAWGNVAGSNIANSLLILGAAALMFPIATREFSAWRDPLIAVGAAAVLWLVSLDASPAPWVGFVLIAGIIGYVYWSYVLERGGSPASATSGPHSRAEALEMADTQIHAPLNGYAKPVLLLITGLVLLVAGAHLLVGGAVEIARIAGMSETVIGLTVVAIGTSLPELVTSAVAAYRKQGGIALGNILGSNIYNILAIGGVVLVAAPSSIPAGFATLEMPLLTGLALLLWLMVAFKLHVSRWIGAVLLAAYAAYLAHSLTPYL